MTNVKNNNFRANDPLDETNEILMESLTTEHCYSEERAKELIEEGKVRLLSTVVCEVDLGWYLVESGEYGTVDPALYCYIDMEKIGWDALRKNDRFYISDSLECVVEIDNE